MCEVCSADILFSLQLEHGDKRIPVCGVSATFLTCKSAAAGFHLLFSVCEEKLITGHFVVVEGLRRIGQTETDCAYWEIHSMTF